MNTFAMSSLLLSVMAYAQEPLSCDGGPVSKTFGGTAWYVYACNDNHSVVVISAPGSAANPFYFMFAFKDGMYRLVGEGTGKKASTDAAHKELSALRETEIAALHREASKTTQK